MPRTRKLLEHRAILELCISEALTMHWEAADQLAIRIGSSPREAACAASRLAADGAIERRKVTRRAAKGRTRSRFEYRLRFSSEGTPAPWSLFPAWLLPAFHEPNTELARRIRGRHTDLTEDRYPMNEIEFNELPRGIRERFHDLKDAQFADHPSVVAARQRLDEHQERHAACVERVTELRLRIEQIQQKQRDARTQLSAIADSRPKLIAEALLAGDDLSADRQSLAKQTELEHFIKAVDSAFPIIQRKFNQANEAMRAAAISLVADEEHLRGVLDELKLAEAQRLFYA